MIMRAEEKVLLWSELNDILPRLQNVNDQNNTEEVRAILLDYVDGFKPQCDNQDWIKN
jgi:FlaA1/EpsC-like NDP-sugar epimerase